MIAQPMNSPTRISFTPVSFVVSAGTGHDAVVPVPSWPSAFKPQHRVVSSVNKTHEEPFPARLASTLESVPEGAVGTRRRSVVLSPI